MKFIIFTTLLIVVNRFHAQENLPSAKDSLSEKPKNLTVGAFVDVYYGYSSIANSGKEIPYFVSMNRNNDFTVNLAFADVKYNSDRARARFAPGFGSYMNANYAAENGGFRNLVEASVGFKLFKKRNIWLDAGVLPSPYTNETVISKDHLMYSRSLAPEYVPYYLCGAKVTLPLSNKLTAYLYVINGWQQITDQNDNKSFGTQLEFKPNDKNLINWDTYTGNERSFASPTFKNRYFSDLYWTYNLSGKWSFTSCVYVGVQEIDDTKRADNYWFQANFMARWRFSPKSSIAARIEYFNDKKGVQIKSINPNLLGQQAEFSSFGYGLCYTLQCTDEVQFRLEARALHSENAHFIENDHFSNVFLWGMSSLVFYFNN